MFCLYNNDLEFTGSVTKELKGKKYIFRIVDGVLQNLDEVKGGVELLPVGDDLRLYTPENAWTKTKKGMIFDEKKSEEIEPETPISAEKKEDDPIEKKEVDVVEVEEDSTEEVIENVVGSLLEDREAMIKEATIEYRETFGKDVPNNKKNNIEWMNRKIDNNKK